MKHLKKLAILSAILLFPATAMAHFGMVIPSDSMVMGEDDRTLGISVSFSHPFEAVGMDMAAPKAFGAITGDGVENLMPILLKTKIMDRAAWRAEFPVRRPGVYTFYMEPAPYWEPAEDCFIIHYTKTTVAAFGEEAGWDRPAGLKTEIVPLSRPFGLYAGNLFQGVVMLDGKPVPNAEVEVEYYNENGRATAPTDYMITQVTRADGNGVFSYAAPRSGWWGFAALSEADFTLPYEGREKPVELGAVIWVRFVDWMGE